MRSKFRCERVSGCVPAQHPGTDCISKAERVGYIRTRAETSIVDCVPNTEYIIGCSDDA